MTTLVMVPWKSDMSIGFTNHKGVNVNLDDIATLVMAQLKSDMSMGFTNTRLAPADMKVLMSLS